MPQIPERRFHTGFHYSVVTRAVLAIGNHLLRTWQSARAGFELAPCCSYRRMHTAAKLVGTVGEHRGATLLESELPRHGGNALGSPKRRQKRPSTSADCPTFLNSALNLHISSSPTTRFLPAPDSCSLYDPRQLRTVYSTRGGRLAPPDVEP